MNKLKIGLSFLMMGSLIAAQDDRPFEIAKAGREARDTVRTYAEFMASGAASGVLMHAKCGKLAPLSRVIATSGAIGMGMGLVSSCNTLIDKGYDQNSKLERGAGFVAGTILNAVGSAAAWHHFEPQMKSFNLEFSRVPFRSSAAYSGGFICGLFPVGCAIYRDYNQYMQDTI